MSSSGSKGTDSDPPNSDVMEMDNASTSNTSEGLSPSPMVADGSESSEIAPTAVEVEEKYNFKLISTSFSPEGKRTFLVSKDFKNFSKEVGCCFPGNPFPRRAVLFKTLASRQDRYHGFLTGMIRVDEEHEPGCPGSNFSRHGREEITHYMLFHRLLRGRGKHIWHLSFVTRDCAVEATDYLMYVLIELPNLRTFALKYYQGDKHNNSKYEVGFSRKEIAKEKREDHEDEESVKFGQYPRGNTELGHIPKIPSLVNLTLIVNRNEAIPKALLDAYAPQLERLECTDVDIFGPGREYSLKKLKILKVWNEDLIANRAILDKMEVMKMPELEELSLELMGIWREKVALEGLIDAISKYSPTLLELVLDLNQPGRIYDMDDVYRMIHFPTGMALLAKKNTKFAKLHTFKVDKFFIGSPLLTNILKRFPALKTISFLTTTAWDQKKKDVWKQVKYLWTEVPTLEKVACEMPNRIWQRQWTRSDLERFSGLESEWGELDKQMDFSGNEDDDEDTDEGSQDDDYERESSEGDEIENPDEEDQEEVSDDGDEAEDEQRDGQEGSD